MTPRRWLVTGATGFVGGAVLQRLLAADAGAGTAVEVRCPVRRDGLAARPGLRPVPVTDLAGLEATGALQGVDAVIHLAARVHVMQDAAPDPLAEHRRINRDLTRTLAAAAARSGVRRFVYLSSIKVNGEATEPGRPFTAEDPPAPQDPYGISKLEAEQALREIEANTGMEVAILRPPLVYGPGVKANFLRMMQWIERGSVLPLGAVDNLRSLVARDNLADLAVVAARHPAAAGRTFMVSDGEDVSTTGLLQRMAAAMGRRARLLPVPPALLQGLASLVGRGDLARRLLGSLQVDSTPARRLLDWTPPLGLDAALAATARDFLARGAGVGRGR